MCGMLALDVLADGAALRANRGPDLGREREGARHAMRRRPMFSAWRWLRLPLVLGAPAPVDASQLSLTEVAQVGRRVGATSSGVQKSL